MSEIWIVDASAVSPLAPDRAGLRRALLAGDSAVAPVTSFATDPYYSRLGAEIRNLEPCAGRSRLAVLLDKACEALGSVPEDALLYGATLKGEIDLKEHYWRDGYVPGAGGDGSDVLFDGLRSARGVAGFFGLRDPGLTFNAACASSLVALVMAAERIASGRSEVILVWAGEILSEFVFAGFASLKALTPDGCRPFDKARNGLVLGEGASLLLLMSADRARSEGREPLACCRGWGIANDAIHLTAPDRRGRGLVKACRRALQRAGMVPDQVEAIKAHGTGTIHNDAMELAAFATLFGHRSLPLFSVKGAVGHTLGAAGALETVVALDSLNSSMLPPTVGFRELEEGASRMRISALPQAFPGGNLLLTNSGFGGVNAALLLSAGDSL